jgi:Cys-rich protein (TIGR01571 family)
MSVTEDIKSGGVQGCFGLDQQDWGGLAGKWYEFWKCAPQCGAPDLSGCLTCVGCWYFCGICSLSKLYSSSLGEECHLIPHCATVWCCGPCAVVFTRYNIRRKLGVNGNMCGDFMCSWFCGCCSFLQVLRASKVEDWNYFVNGVNVPPIVAPQTNFIK